MAMLRETQDWKDKRFELAKAAMQGLLAHYGKPLAGLEYEIPFVAREQADLLLKALEEGEK